MKNLDRFLRNRAVDSYEPLIFDFKKVKDFKKVAALLKQKKTTTVVDEFSEQLKELAVVKNPKLLQKPTKNTSIKNNPKQGKWIYYPWRTTLVHVLDRENYIRLKNSRNENLILPSEQRKFAQFRIGIAGLNVGNPAAVCIALEGGLGMKFADNDVLTLSNFNRFRASLADLGVNKAVLSARQVYEINPFAKIEVFPDGIKPANLDKFLLKPKIDVLIEEMDNLPLKIAIREHAKKYRIPVVMVTGNGENLILDVERFDLNPRLPLLNGYLKDSIIDKVKTGKIAKMSFKQRILTARDFMGAKFLVSRLRKSFLQVGTKLAGIPQLAETSFLRGAVLCYVVRQIAVGGKMPSDRYRLDLNKIVSSH